MLQLPTVVLAHEKPGGRHYDLLIAMPDAPVHGPLRAWRIGLAPWDWAAARRIALTPLPDHRRVYLRREGSLGAGRGHVRRVDEGVAIVEVWREHRMLLEMRLAHFRGRVEIGRDLVIY